MNKELKTYLVLIGIVVIIILSIFYIKKITNTDILDDESAKCIAEKSIIYSQTSCSHCIQQKKLLGDYIKYFKIIECDASEDDSKICIDEEVKSTPTWKINDKLYEGLQSIRDLKKITGC
ncbi:MAG: hypothetical protein Q8N99_05995 [Nanoarchaeota archaeon]|nr:hypothetical protein [Nanoarchaeota archaeon]